MKTKLLLIVLMITSLNLSLLIAQSKNGSFKSYHENGKVKSIENYNNGKKHGVCKYYYDNGVLKCEESYNDNGLKDGEFKSFYKNGQLESRYTYMNGEKHGIYKEYNEEGKLIEEGRYEYGNRKYYPIRGDNEAVREETVTSSNRESTNKDVIYEKAERMPQFKGGESELYKFIADNLRYPSRAAEAGIQGRVTVKFIVDVNGNILNPKITRRIDSSLEEEALRIVRLMPKWIPGQINGQNVSVYFTLPIQFKLSM